MADTLPTEQDYARAIAALSTAYEELDAICFRFVKLFEDGERENPVDLDPSLVDVGALYSFTEDIRHAADDLARFDEKLTGHLRELDATRLDLEAARRHPKAA